MQGGREKSYPKEDMANYSKISGKSLDTDAI